MNPNAAAPNERHESVTLDVLRHQPHPVQVLWETFREQRHLAASPEIDARAIGWKSFKKRHRSPVYGRSTARLSVRDLAILGTVEAKRIGGRLGIWSSVKHAIKAVRNAGRRAR